MSVRCAKQMYAAQMQVLPPTDSYKHRTGRHAHDVIRPNRVVTARCYIGSGLVVYSIANILLL